MDLDPKIEKKEEIEVSSISTSLNNNSTSEDNIDIYLD